MNERKAIELYDKFTELRNRKEYRLLTKEVFHEYGIDTLQDLSRHLRKYGEYGGAVKFPFSSCGAKGTVYGILPDGLRSLYGRE